MPGRFYFIEMMKMTEEVIEEQYSTEIAYKRREGLYAGTNLLVVQVGPMRA